MPPRNSLPWFKDLRGHAPTLWMLLGLALAARLPLWLGSPGAAFDMESYRLTSEQLLGGGPLYGSPVLAHRYPYLPLWALIAAPLALLARASGLAAPILYKAPGVLADLGLVFLIYRMVLRLRPAEGAPRGRRFRSPAFWSALAYAVNPLAILITAGHGQFDSLALFFIVVAAYFFEFSTWRNAESWAALGLSTAIALKSWPAFFLPVFLKNLGSWRERFRFSAWCLLPLALLCLPFLLRDAGGLLKTLAGYHGATALSLPETLHSAAYLLKLKQSLFMQLADGYAWIALGLLGISLLAYGSSRVPVPLLPGILLAVLTLYVFAPAYSVQYLSWLLPFAILSGGRLVVRHTFCGLVMLLFFYLAFLPGAVLAPPAGGPPALPSWLLGLWGGLNGLLWLFWALEWRKTLKQTGLAS